MTIEVKELRINTSVDKEKPKNEKDLCNDLDSIKKEIMDDCKKLINQTMRDKNIR